MDKKLMRKLWRTALFSSPILALYGVTPLYLFNTIPARLIFFAGIGVLLNVVLFWIANIVIIQKGESLSTTKRWLLSYAITLIIHLALLVVRIILLEPQLEFEQNIKSLTNPGTFLVYPITAVFAINTIILIITGTLLLAYKKEKAELEIEHLKVSSLEAQKKVLVQQLQPHFLFNTLSVLKSLIRQNATEAENYTIKLSEFLRYTVQPHQGGLVLLKDELKFAQDYIELQKVRFEEALLVNIDIPQPVQDQSIPPYAIQALVENAIKHNAFTEKKPLHISIRYNDGAIVVCNNKFLTKAEESAGTGLNNLAHRYRLIANREIIVRDEAQQFCVSLPLINQPPI